MAKTDTTVEVTETELRVEVDAQELPNIDELLSEVALLKSKLENAQSICEDLRSENEELKKSRQALSLEIMDLTKALFEEAGGMVAEEARARAKLEETRIKLKGELENTKEYLRLEKQQLFELRERLSKERLQQAIGGTFNRCGLFNVLTNEPFSHRYFPILFPTARSDLRHKYQSASSAFWDGLSQKFETEEVREFSKFVGRISELDAENILKHHYVKRICEEDVGPCLNFPFKPRPFMKKLILAMLRNFCSIERVSIQERPGSKIESNRIIDSARTVTSKASSIISSDESVMAVDLEMVDVDYGSIQTNVTQLTTIVNSGNSLTATSISASPGDRLRGIMSHFTTSVSSLPESLLPGPEASPSKDSKPLDCPKFCSLCGQPGERLKYRFRISDTDNWNYIDRGCRLRLVAAGHFFTFLRHLRAGLHANRPILDLYYDTLQFRRLMFYARLHSAATAYFIQSDYEAFLEIVEKNWALVKEVETSIGDKGAANEQALGYGIIISN